MQIILADSVMLQNFKHQIASITVRGEGPARTENRLRLRIHESACISSKKCISLETGLGHCGPHRSVLMAVVCVILLGGRGTTFAHSTFRPNEAFWIRPPSTKSCSQIYA